MTERPERQRLQRIEELKAKVEAIAGGNVAWDFSDDCPGELKERFLESVLAFETATEVVPFDLLAQAGMALEDPARLPDARIHSQLHQVIDAMAGLGMYLYNTDHLSDRELYERLWGEILREPTILMPKAREFACHVDLIGTGSEEDNRLYLKYYADEDDRRQWAEDYPEDDIPAHEDPPCDRDRYLPEPG